MCRLRKLFGIYCYNLGELSDDTLKSHVNYLQHILDIRSDYSFEIQSTNHQISFEISRTSLETNVYNPIFCGKLQRKNEEWEFLGKFAYEKIAQLLIYISYALVLLTLALCLLIPSLNSITPGIYCIFSYLAVVQLIASKTSSKKREEILGIINRSIINAD